LRHATNRGKGAALKTGFEYVLSRLPKCIGVITADADGQHSAEDVARIAERFAQDKSSLLLGVRRFSSEVPLRSRVGNRISRWLVRFLIGHNLQDTQTGLRAIPRSLLADLVRITSNHYEFELDMLIACKHSGYRILQEPIDTIYIDNNRSSHFNPLRDSLKIYFVLLRFGSLSLATTLLDNLLFGIAYMSGTGIAAAQIIARIGASSFNYTRARRAVFLSNEKHSILIPRYLANVAVSGLVSYALIRYLVNGFGISVFWCKAIAETLLFVVNFIIQREMVFVRHTTGYPATDWDVYYERIPFFARLARRYTSSALVRNLRRYSGLRPNQGVIVELGGANSCFMDRLRAEFRPKAYHVVDNNSYGLGALRKRTESDTSVILHQQDVLSRTLPIRADVVFSIGLVEHFDPTGTQAAIRAHFDLLSQDGIAIVSFPTPTLLYRVTRACAEGLGLWRFHDERPLLRTEILKSTAGIGQLLQEHTLWPLVLTQHLMIFRKETPNHPTKADHLATASSRG
jgi:putative flippase GtrA